MLSPISFSPCEKTALRSESSPRQQMRLRVAFVAFCLFATVLSSPAQILFTYGNHTVDKREFLKAYNKNNSDSNGTKVSYADYLDLYEKFRMKVQAAIDQKLDTTQQQVSEAKAFHNQLAENYLKENASIELLVKEAAQRSRKDIHLTDIYSPLKPEPTADEIKSAEIKINEAYSKLKSGEPFEKVASEYNYADFGFVTAFILPYDVENIAYTTPLGEYAKPHQGSKGFHILRPTEERKALGKIRVAQILLAFLPNAGDQSKKITAQRADSVYDALKAGADFSALAQRLSNDNLSYQAGGQLPVFGIGEYDPAFEKAAFELAKDSDISRPVETTFGYHIIKRIARIPVPDGDNNKEWNTVLKERVEQSDRMKVAQQKLVEHIRQKIKNDAPAETQTSDTAAIAYYREHLEKYNNEFADQLREFKEGNLLFTMMQKKVWDAASSDSAGLLKYYNDNRGRYRWENSADALMITCENKKEVSAMRNSTKANFANWRKWADGSNGLIQADSGRFELSQIPVVERTNFVEGLATAPVASAQDSSAVFAYIIKLYPAREPKKFEDARGAVISDYQAYLESNWIAELKQKYPVKVNKKVFRSL